MAYNWISILGTFEHDNDAIIFKGGETTSTDGSLLHNVGNFICNQAFGGGIISGEIEFLSSSENEGCEFILFYYPPTKAFITAGLGGGGGLCSIRTWTGDQWIIHAVVGEKKQISANRIYNLSVSVQGSRITVTIDGVNALITNLPFSIPRGQTGIWCIGKNDIKINKYHISMVRPKIFVVMQFTPQYNELYSNVIKPVCKDLALDAIRADETYEPGLIIADITRKIIEATVIIAEITPANPNVYYEVGYAHALNKPTILIAEKPTKIPFDVSPFRVLFYENTIGGKAKIEAGLRKHLNTILTQWETTTRG